MANPIFVQDSRIGRAIFEIHEDHLDVSIARFGRKSEHRIPLRSIDPKCRQLSRRTYLLIAINLAISLAGAFVARGILRQNVFPHEVVMFPVMFICTGLWAAVRGIPPVVFYEFLDLSGKSVLHVIRERKQAEECDAFVAALVLRIEMAIHGLPSGEFSRSLAGLKPSQASAARINQDRWLASIVLGGLGAVIPMVPGYDFTAEPFIILLCTGGAALGVFSFLAKEPRRWFAVLGIVLSLIPPYFY